MKLLEIMKNLETERLLLRPFTMDDLDEAYAILEGHPDVWRYDPGFQRTREQRAEELQFRIGELRRKGVGCLAVTLKETRALIGYCGLQLYILEGAERSTPEIELFYKLGRKYWGHGYATEAGREMIRYAFEELKIPRIVSWADAANEHSVRLMWRLGMRVESAADFPDEVTGTLENPLFIQEQGNAGLNLEELVAGVTDENLHGEFDTGPAWGNEAW